MEKANWIQPQMAAPSAGLMLSLSEFIEFIWCQRHSCKVVINSTAASAQHTCIRVYLTIFTETPSLASRTKSVKYIRVLPWETCCHSWSFFTGNGRLVQCHQGSQVPLPTGGLSWGQRRGGEEVMGTVAVGETSDGSVETVMAFLKTPVYWKAITVMWIVFRTQMQRTAAGRT